MHNASRIARSFTILVLFSAGVARAQEVRVEEGPPPTVEVPAAAPSSTPLTLEVRAPEVVDAERLRAELERDLRARVELVSPGADGAGVRMIVELTEEGILRLRVRRGEDAELARETPPSEDRDQLTLSVSLLLSNLVRDESDELVALLRVRVPAPAPSEVPAPVPMAPEPAPPPLLPPPAPSELAEVPVGVDFVPAVGVSSAFLGRDARAFSLGVVGGLAGDIDGLALSSVLDLALGSVEGAQIGGALALTGGDVRGLQLGGALAIGGGMVEGLQIGGALAIGAGDLHGLQLGGAASFIGGRLAGVQIAGALAVAPAGLEGLQLSTVNVAGGEVRGAQLAAVNVAAGALDGAQIGIVNVAAGSISGTQIGVVNIAAGRVSGLQLGVVNISEESDAAIGLVSVHTRGRTHLRAGLDTNGFLGASLVHGGGVMHSIVSVAVEPFLAKPAAALGLGLGARARFDDVVHLDVELLAHALLDEDVAQAGPDLMPEARVLVGFRLVDGVALYVGAAYRVHVSWGDAPELGSPFLEHQLATDPLVRGWPALLGGVELF